MAPGYRCTCTSHKCKDVLDPAGQAGVVLDARKFRMHTQDDKNAKIRTLAEEAQKKVLLEEDVRLSTALRQLSVTDNTPGIAKPLPDQDRYRVDTARRLLSHISVIIDRLAPLRVELDSIGEPPTLPVNDFTVIEVLQRLASIQSSAEALDHDLKMVTRRSKIPSVVAFRDESIASAETFLSAIQDIRRGWQTLQDARSSTQKRCIKWCNGVQFM